MSDLTILRRLAVEDVLSAMDSPVKVHSNDSAQLLLDLSKQQAVSDFIVVDEQEHYVGLVTAADLKQALLYSEAIPLLQVNELQRVDLPTVTADETLDRVLDKFSRFDVHSLAVLEANGEGLVCGLITRGRLMQKYQQELDKD